jgi:hypothetical protein
LPHHYTKDVTEAPFWCNRCGRETQHRVFDGRLAHCLEHSAQEFTKAQLKKREKQEKEKREPKLF